LNACVGLTTQLSGTGSPAALNPWVSNNPLVATIDNSGLVTGVSAGTTTITYTNSNGCQITATVIINVLPALTGTFNACVGLTTQLSGTGSPAAVNPWVSTNPLVATINNSGLVTGVSAGTTTITYTNSNGCQITATVTINGLPNATISGTTAVCLNAASPQIILTGANGTAPYIFTYSTDGGITTVTTPPSIGNTYTIPVSTAVSGVFTYTLVSIQDGATPACSQNQSGTATVTVNTAPTISTPTPYVVCDDSLNNDGFYCFNLAIKNSEITIDPNVVITYHETLTDSQTGANPMPSPYCNITPGNQILYVRANFIGSSSCYSNTTLQLVVNPIPLPNPVITDYELCDYNNSGDGIEVFNLGTKTTEIDNGQTGVTVSYYETLADAQGQTSALSNLYSNATNPQQIWINIKDNVTGCNTTSSFNLIVNPLPGLTTPPALFECSNGSSPTAEFDLTINEGSVTNGVSGLVVTYYNTLLAAQNGSPTITGAPSAYTGTDNEIVYIRVENIVTGCYATTTQLLRVTQGPLAITPLPLHYCDPNNDGFGVFDLDSTINEILGGILPPGVSVTFHETPTDALLGANPKPSPYANINVNTQTIYVRVYYTLTGCANYVELQLIVDPTPIATEPNDYELCDYTGSVGFETFDLTTTIPQILGSLNPLTYAVTFYTSQAAAEIGTGNITNPTSYTNGTINTETIYVRVENTLTGCYDIVTLQLIVTSPPNSNQPNYPQYSLCDVNQSTPADIGFETFDLASQVASILLGQTGMDVTFYPSLAEAQNNINAITNLQYTNAIIYVQTLGIRITNTTTGCYVISTMDIRVEPLPTPIPPTQPYTICDDNQDGFANFDLAILIPDLLQGANYLLSFHETLSDANSNTNAIPTSVLYFSINPFVQTLYVRAEDAITGCFSILPIELNAEPSPVSPVNLNPITVCDQDSNPQSASTLVNLTQQTAAVLAQQTGVATNYTVTYYTSQLLAEQGTAPIIPATSYFGSNLQTIWVRVENNNTQCYNIGSFQLQINTPLLLTTPAPSPLSLCDDDANPNNQFHVFNLTVRDTDINQGTTATVTYYPSLLDAQNGTNVITTPTAYQNDPLHPAVQTLGVVVTTTAGCKSITTLDIRVLPIPIPNTNPTPLAPKCDDNIPGDMLEVFDLTANAAYIINGDPNVTLHYFATQVDAAANQNELIPATAALVGTNVWIRVENNRVDYQGNNCYVLVEQPLTVNPLPIVVQPLTPYRACDDNTDGIAVFDLTNPQLAIAILGATQLPANYTISYYLTIAGANPLTNTGETPLSNNYTNVTPNAETIYIRVVNNTTGCVNTGILPLVVEPYATATGPQMFNQCDSYTDPYDGVELIDLTTYAPAILNGQDPTIFLVSYYTSLADAQAGTNALTLAEAQAYQTDADTDTIWVKVENSANLITPFCNAITTIDITVERYPNPIINTANNVTTICVNFITNQVVRPLTLNSGVTNPSNYIFQWFEAASATPIPGATGPSYTVDTPSPTGATRDYTVTVTSNSPLACQTTSLPFSVIQSGQAVIPTIPTGNRGYTVTSAFSSLQTITVNIEGYGAPDYQYSLDDGPRQTSNVFENVSLGTHVIHVWDGKGDIAYSCEELIITEVEIIDYPHYFTPNGDGIHDTWNIVGLADRPGTRIYIFDRYGKLLKQISSTGAGWDGTYNGYLMPSDDYWFTVDYEDDNGVMKQFKAHFAMKR
jgi:gliding motility-associated-like protein